MMVAEQSSTGVPPSQQVTRDNQMSRNDSKFVDEVWNWHFICKKKLTNNSSYNYIQPKETGSSDVWTEQWPKKYLPAQNLF